jgi:putative phage-type endonuclease
MWGSFAKILLVVKSDRKNGGVKMAERTSFIGGSDCAAVLGLSRWKTPLEVWAEKTGNIVPEDISEKLHIKLGNRLEEVVAELFCEKTGKKVRRVNETLFHKQHSFLGANIDRRVVGEDTILECKTCSAWKAKEWEGEDIPQEYVLQCLHYLAVTGAQKAYIAVLIGNQNFHFKEILRDEKIISDILKREVSFWQDFVEPKIMPAAMVSKNDDDALFKLFPSEAEGKIIDGGDNAAVLFETLEAAKQDYFNIKGLIDKTENEIKALMQDADTINGGKWRATWREMISKRLDTTAIKEQEPAIAEKFTKQSKSRVFRVNEIKEKKQNDNKSN